MARGNGIFTIAAVVAFGLAVLCGCGRPRSAATPRDAEEPGPDSSLCIVSDETAEAGEWADSLLSSMTLEERAGQCLMPSIYADGSDATMRRLLEYIADVKVGGIVLLKGDMTGAARMSALCREAGVPPFVAIDAEWGLGMRLSDAPGYPRNGDIPEDAGEEVMYDYGREVARECRALGIDMVLGPVIDVVGNKDGMIGKRSFGADAVRVADLGVAYARGLESGNVISVAKHFPGHGSPAGDSHRTLPMIERSLHQLDSMDLYPFRCYSDAGLSAVMVGHLAVPALDSGMLPAAVSRAVIKDLLREEVGFKGLVVTDAMNMAGASGYGAADALAAGADIVIGPDDTLRERDGIIRAVETGSLAPDRLEDAVRRILVAKYLHRVGSRGASTVSHAPLAGIFEEIHSGSDTINHRLVPSPQ